MCTSLICHVLFESISFSCTDAYCIALTHLQPMPDTCSLQVKRERGAGKSLQAVMSMYRRSSRSAASPTGAAGGKASCNDLLKQPISVAGKHAPSHKHQVPTKADTITAHRSRLELGPTTFDFAL